MKEFARVAKTSEVSEGEITFVEIGEERILLSKVDGSYQAVGEVCTHAEGPLSDGYVENGGAECPWHGNRFDLKTGEATGLPATEPLTHYAVRVDGDDILVESRAQSD